MSVVTKNGIRLAKSTWCNNNTHARCQVEGCECKCHMLAKVKQ